MRKVTCLKRMIDNDNLAIIFLLLEANSGFGHSDWSRTKQEVTLHLMHGYDYYVRYSLSRLLWDFGIT